MMEKCTHIVLSGRCQKCGAPVQGADINAPGYDANPGQTGIRRRNNAIRNFQTAEGNSPLYQNSRRILVDEFGYTDAELIRLRNRAQTTAAEDPGQLPQGRGAPAGPDDELLTTVATELFYWIMNQTGVAETLGEMIEQHYPDVMDKAEQLGEADDRYTELENSIWKRFGELLASEEL